MKKVKVITLIFGLIFLLSLLFYFFKQPIYSIKTEGTLYVVNKVSKSVVIFDLFKGKQIKELPIQIEPHEATTLTNLKKVVVTNYGTPKVGGKSVTVIDTETNTIEKTISIGEGNLRPHGIIALPNSNKVAVVTDTGNNLSIVNIETGIVEKEISTKQDLSHLLVKHPFKPLIYVSNINSGSVSVINMECNSVVNLISCSKKSEGIGITKNGDELWVTNIQENFISVINTETNKITDRIDTGKEPLRLKFSIDGKYCLVSNSSDGTISVYSSKTKKQITTIIIPGNKNILEKVLYHTPRPVGILMHPNGKYAFVSNYTGNRVEVVDMQNFTIVSSIKVGEMPDGLAFVK